MTTALTLYNSKEADMDYRADVIQLWKQSKLSRQEFAQMTGVTYPSFCRFLNTATGKTVAERLIPFVYGDKRDELLKNAGAQND